MAQTVRDVMSTQLCEIGLDDPIAVAARMMRDENVGDVLVVDGGKVRGILTDRDIVLRAIADGMDPEREPVDAIYSGSDVATVTPETPLEHAAALMRAKAVRRLPVMDGERAVGIVSIGDLALARDRESALGDISEAPPNS